MPDRNPEDVFRKLADDALDQAAFDGLEDALRQSPDLRRRYVRYMELEGLLHEECQWTPAEPKLGIRRRSANAVRGIALIATALAASICGLAVWWQSGSESLYQESNLQGHTDVAVVKGWHNSPAAEKQLQPGMRLKPGSVKLPTGQLNLSFHGGADLELHGPAELHLLSEGEATLVFGEVAVEVPSAGTRFVLNSPHSSLVDNQSKYSLTVDARASIVNVFDGSLVASQLGADGYTYTSETVKRSQSLRATAYSLELFDSGGPESERTQKIQDSEKLRVPQEYVDLIVSASPAVYWRFESGAEQRIVNEMGEEHEGEFVYSGEELGEELVEEQGIEIVDGMARFYESPCGRIIRSRDPLEDFLNAAYSVELWVRPNPRRQQSILSLVPEEGRVPWDHGLLFEFATRKTALVHPENSFRFLHRARPAQSGGVNLFTGGGCSPNVWHYLAAVKTPDELRLYHNGKLVGLAKISGDSSPEALVCHLGQLRIPGIERQYSGYVDEMAIYRRELLPFEVREHFGVMRAAQQESKPVSTFGKFQ